MGKNDLFTKSLAAAGTLLAWAAILFMLATSIPGSISSGSFRMDYMIPAEIFFIPLIGTGLLIWAAFRARLHKKLILWSFAAEILMLVGSQGLAVVTGLASGAAEPAGWRMWLVLGGLILFDLAQALVGIGGILLVKDLSNPASHPQPAN